MTLHCNKVNLWPCPEWVAKMCMHEIGDRDPGVEICVNDHYGQYNYDWALERYLMWAYNLYEECQNSREQYQWEMNVLTNYKTHVKEICNIMNNPDLKVWIE